jgi:hypothetical protein
LAEKKRGRPTDNPKPFRIAVKMDARTKDILERYCRQENVTQMEAARRGIRKLEVDLKEGEPPHV